MFFSIVLGFSSVLLFLLFGDKKKLPLFLPTCLFASLVATMTDLLMIPYPLWGYPSVTPWSLYYRQLIHTFTLYPVVVYLFIQTLPKKQNFFTVARHIFYCTIPCIFLEWICLQIKYIEHKLWWNLGCSYISDWILFSWFYLYYKWLRKYMKTASV
jgi:hypothetical protein